MKSTTSVSACLMHKCSIALALCQKLEINEAFRGIVAVEKTVEDIYREKNPAKTETRKALRGAVIQKKDCPCIFPTDFGKALIFQPIPFAQNLLYVYLWFRHRETA